MYVNKARTHTQQQQHAARVLCVGGILKEIGKQQQLNELSFVWLWEVTNSPLIDKSIMFSRSLSALLLRLLLLRLLLSADMMIINAQKIKPKLFSSKSNNNCVATGTCNTNQNRNTCKMNNKLWALRSSKRAALLLLRRGGLVTWLPLGSSGECFYLFCCPSQEVKIEPAATLTKRNGIQTKRDRDSLRERVPIYKSNINSDQNARQRTAHSTQQSSRSHHCHVI